MGAAAVRRRVGLAGSIIVGFMDLAKGAMAVLLAQKLGLALPFVLIAGLTVVAGHNWSVFLHFKGGKGALTTYGVLATLMFWQFLIALFVSGASYFIFHKTGVATGFLFGSLFLINLLTGSLILLTILPILISAPMILKHIFMPKAGAVAMAKIESPKSEER
jgi:glycerol-3-phosphate acyltransferase PlsY